MIIERVRPREIDEVRKLLLATWRDSYGKYYSEEEIKRITSILHNPKLLHKQLNEKNTYFAAVKENKKIIGVITIRRIADEILMLERLYILPDHQCKGIGSQLLSSGRDYFSDAKKLRVECGKKNNKACAFYLKKGFKIISEKGQDVAGVEMETVEFEQEI